MHETFRQVAGRPTARLAQLRLTRDTELIGDDHPSTLIDCLRIEEQSVHIKDRTFFHEPLPDHGQIPCLILPQNI